MAQPILIIYFLSLVLFVNAVPFDFFQLVQQWGPNVCNVASVSPCYTSPKPMFTIHGLWPSNYTNARLVCNSKLQYIKPTSLETQLDTYWPDLIHGNNDSNSKFWSHEWDEHGKCSTNLFNVFDYFRITLDLRKKYDLLAILNAAGLNPPISKGLLSQDIITAIQNTTNKKPGVRCNKIGRKPPKFQLYEIVLCIDKDGVTLINCPPFVSSSCPTQIAWLLPQENSIGVSDYP